MILQGIDIVSVSRMKKIMSGCPELATEIFSDDERKYCFSRRDPYVHLAGRFAAKEACLKALGTGLSGEGIDASLREIEVKPGRSGKPVLSISGWIEKMGRRRRVCQYTVSISHSGDYAVACVILATKNPVGEFGNSETGN